MRRANFFYRDKRIDDGARDDRPDCFASSRSHINNRNLVFRDSSVSLSLFSRTFSQCRLLRCNLNNGAPLAQNNFQRNTRSVRNGSKLVCPYSTILPRSMSAALFAARSVRLTAPDVSFAHASRRCHFQRRLTPLVCHQRHP